MAKLGTIKTDEEISSGLISADIISVLGYTPENAANKKTDLAADSETYTPTQSAVNDALALKQDVLVSGTNIKTINSTSLLGSGDIAVSSDSNIDGGNPSSSYVAAQILDGEGV